jgi:putative endonuclease
MAGPHHLGRRSEDLAADYLKSCGYTILERNFRVGRKEIDLIVRKEEVVAFVEVKARAGRGCGHPLEAITWAKRREIAFVARAWIADHAKARTYQFDAIAVTWQGADHRIEHVENAWQL